MSVATRILRPALAVAIALLLVELVSIVFARTLGDRFSWFDASAFALDDEDLTPKLRAYFHPILGWKKPYATPFGERPREIDYPSSLMATFGDSYTHCDQVEDDQTWQTYLSRRTGANVYNFGNGAYGTGQALLRFREDYPAVRTPIATLGLITENINRVVNRYRKFYYPRTGTPLTKPMFVLEEGELELLPNPIRRADELERLRDLDFLAEIGARDLWYNRNDFPRRAFPYSRFLINRSFWLEVRHGRLGIRVGDLDGRPWVNLWEDEGARDLMFAIFDRFVEEARARACQPVLLVLPTKRHVMDLVARGQESLKVRTIVDFAERKGYAVFDGVRTLASAASGPDDVHSFYRNHLTPAGNEAFANGLYEFLRSSGLLPPEQR